MLDHAILTSMIDAVSSQECYTVKTNFNKLLNEINIQNIANSGMRKVLSRTISSVTSITENYDHAGVS